MTQDESTDNSVLARMPEITTDRDSVDTKPEEYYNINRFVEKRAVEFERNRLQFKKTVRDFNNEEKIERKSRKVIKETNIL